MVSLSPALISRHGVMLELQDKGILLVGPPGIGKSSLALDLMYQGATLIADDLVEIYLENNVLMSQCPTLSSGLLHSRELGLIDVRHVFNSTAWQACHPLDFIIQLLPDYKPAIQLQVLTETQTVMGINIPVLNLSIQNPASVLNRIRCWLTLQTRPQHAAKTLQQQQRQAMKH